MSFDLDGLRGAVRAHGRIARVVVLLTEGSTPREAGASMLVWPGGQAGTIGGGTLEHVATMRALEALETGRDRYEVEILGPGIGQCCGGRVGVLTEVFDVERAERTSGPVVARPLPGADPIPPEAVRARLEGRAEARPGLVEGWAVEPLLHSSREIWIWGAGHVGRALVSVLAPLPELAITWLDVAEARFPPEVPPGIRPRWHPKPAALVAEASPRAEHLVLTHSHRLDFEICAALLRHEFRRAGLIGSKTKAARFRSGLRKLGFDDEHILRIRTPIGDKRLGKHPQAIAISVAATLLRSADLDGAPRF